MKRFLKNYAVTALCMMLWAFVALPAHAVTLVDESDLKDLNWIGKINYIISQGGTFRRDCLPIKEMSTEAQYRNGTPNKDFPAIKDPKIITTHECYDVMEIIWPERYRGVGPGYVADPKGDERFFAQTRTNGSTQIWCIGTYYDGHDLKLLEHGYQGQMHCTKEGTTPRLGASWIINNDSYGILEEQKD